LIQPVMPNAEFLSLINVFIPKISDKSVIAN